MNKKQSVLVNELKNILEEIDMQCIEDEEFNEKINSLDIFSRNINDIVEDISDTVE